MRGMSTFFFLHKPPSSFNTSITANSSWGGERFVVNCGVCGTARLAPGISLECTFDSKWETLLLVYNPSLEIYPLKQLFALAWSHFKEVLIWPWMFWKVRRDRPFPCQRWMLWQIHHVSLAVRLGEKTIKGFTRRSSRPDSQWSSPRVGLGTIDSLGNASEGGMRGRQLDDLQYMRLRTRGTKKD